MHRPTWAPEGVDIDRPNAARMYDYALGGSHNFEVDRALVEQAETSMPDIDPVAVAHSRSLLENNPGAHAIEGDLRHPDGILAHPEANLDLSEPVAVLLFAVLHFVGDDDDPATLVRRLHDAVPAGSFLAISHGSPPPERAGDAENISRLYRRTPSPLHLRTREQILPLLRPFDLVEPGLVPVTDWHPDDPVGETQDALLGAVAVKR